MKIKNFLLLNFLLFLLSVPYINNLEFKKNLDSIKLKESENSLVKKVNSLKEFHLYKEKNHIILFYADWCTHW